MLPVVLGVIGGTILIIVIILIFVTCTIVITGMYSAGHDRIWVVIVCDIFVYGIL